MLIAVDWGSSHFRAMLLDEQGAIIDRRASNQGVLSNHSPAKGSEATFAQTLVHHCQAWRQQHGPLPCYLGGMVGSRSGWREVDYVDAKQPLSQLSHHLAEVGENSFIVPGIAQQGNDQAADVMRGEEIQILGALQSLDSDCARLCLPGTHSKWADVTIDNSHAIRDGIIQQFSTFITGELFQWVHQHSSLASLMKNGELTSTASPQDDPRAFLAGVNAADSNLPLSQLLFSIRSRGLLGKLDGLNPSEYLSGLIIGQEISAGLRLSNDLNRASHPVTIIGNAALSERYQLALSHFHQPSHFLNGDEAFCRGILCIHQYLQPLKALQSTAQSQSM